MYIVQYVAASSTKYIIIVKMKIYKASLQFYHAQKCKVTIIIIVLIIMLSKNDYVNYLLYIIIIHYTPVPAIAIVQFLNTSALLSH